MQQRPRSIPTHDSDNVNDYTSGKFGKLSYFCTVVRLMAGEWRIQLGRLLVDEPINSRDGNDAVSAMCRVLSDYCGIAVAALQEVMRIATAAEESGSLTVSPDALLHIRESFRDVLHSCIDFYNNNNNNSDTSNDINTRRRMDGEDDPTVSIARVFGAIMAEFSVWEELPTGTTVEEGITAMTRACRQHFTGMLPGLLATFALSDGSGDKQLVVVASAEILRFWRGIRVSEDASILELVCQLILVLDERLKNRAQVRESMTYWWMTQRPTLPPTTVDLVRQVMMALAY